MDLFKNSSKQSLSVENCAESSTPLAGKGKQIEQGDGEVFTHFISIPLAIYPELKEKVEAFRTTVIGMGVDSSFFGSPSTLHMTVVMLTLKDDKAVGEALRILNKQKPSLSERVLHALDKRPVFIRLQGLDCMEESLDKTRVLYVPVEEVGNEGRLLSACHIIIDEFVKAGFAEEDAKSNLKLHVTLMNASYRRYTKSKRMETFDAQKIHENMETFDARKIYEKFWNLDWGSYLIKEAQFSKRSWYDTKGYFHSCGSLPFPCEPASDTEK